MNLGSHFRRLDTRFLALSKRERVIMLVLTIVVLLAIGQFAIFLPLQNTIRAEQQMQEQRRRDTELLENEYAQLQSFVAGQNDVAIVASLEQKLADIQQRMTQLGNRMVAPSEMVELLQQLLSKESGMRVVALEKLPLERDNNGEPNGQPDSQLFRHRLRLTLYGNYLENLRYLQRMEALPWQVFWDRLHYRVEQYPNAYVTIEIATLADNKEWIGG
ncbi:type II secretion system protein M [Permianibacter aggregans]|uniref:MSHA biogenesis protein MshJ n=1 Tax=Permianibacter aggregans TaxID=1510150 RepID=A0A4R6UTE1_9GAMM|nr:type II secretion system protein M [Permianibacter aggregans]QGX38642.1 hypothetical protein E2H98_02795 [Permianibacter aggregans]TDQ50431.1 MSHA biogenesis protein MshJ [Permianibacter aggregans]